jgi:hypothetical protein
MKTALSLCLAAIVICACLPVHADDVTPQERRDCRVEYKTYCNAYKIGSQALRACMSRASKKLGVPCVQALYAAGEITRAEAEKLIHAHR